MKKFVKKLILLFISIQFAACEGNLEPHLYGVVDYAKKAGDLIYSAMEVLL